MNLFLARLLGGSILRAPSDEGGGSAPAAEAPAAAPSAPAAEAPAERKDDSGPLTVAQAVDRLMNRPHRADVEELDDAGGADPAEGGDGEDQDLPDSSAGDGEGGSDDGSTTAETEGEGEPAKPAIEPPKFWSAEDKAAFALMPQDLQERVLKYAKMGDQAAATAMEEAAAVRKRAEETASGLGQLKADLDKLVPAAKAKFEQTWPENIDWVAVSKEFGAEVATNLKFQHDQDQAELVRLQTAQREADAKEHAAFLSREFAALKTIRPELVDGEKGAERRAATAKFLLDGGVHPDQIRRAGAREFAMAYDAMLFRDAQKSLDTPATKPVTKPAQGRPAVAPGAGQAPRTSQQRSVSEARGRFNQKPSVANAAALIEARSKSR